MLVLENLPRKVPFFLSLSFIINVFEFMGSGRNSPRNYVKSLINKVLIRPSMGVTEVILIMTLEAESRAFFMWSMLLKGLADRCRESCYPMAMGRRIGAMFPAAQRATG